MPHPSEADASSHPSDAAPGPHSAFEFVLDKLQPPTWVIAETQNRLVLLLNHVLLQEPEAMARLQRQKGRSALVQWGSIAIQFVATPAGLLRLAGPNTSADLKLTVAERSPLALLRQVLTAQKPEVRMEGDVQFAAEINWLADHVRWDIEEDLSRIVGDAPAHALGEAARRAAQAIRGFVAQRNTSAAHSSPTAAAGS